jgi:RNA polymerase sigma factor (sigma-70 family)
MISDEQIINGCKKGKRHAFNMLYKKYAAIMLGVCLRYSRNKVEAEDILQEGFIKVFKKIGSFEGRGKFQNWLKRIMVNTAINHYKANKKFYQNEEFEPTNKEHAESDFQTDESFQNTFNFTADELMEMINTLPDGYRMVFNLYVFEGFSHQEISDIMEIGTGTSKSQLSKARKYLRKKVEEKQKKMIDA